PLSPVDTLALADGGFSLQKWYSSSSSVKGFPVEGFVFIAITFEELIKQKAKNNDRARTKPRM
ncbi:hypothetical protein, partial [Sansalvadorimonas verongulae]|uniref:hypothetical protein n=1 Tax=Sansalvadorimonas verongulae TaxID=2172824 RepID=UPI001E2FA55A